MLKQISFILLLQLIYCQLRTSSDSTQKANTVSNSNAYQNTTSPLYGGQDTANLSTQNNTLVGLNGEIQQQQLKNPLNSSNVENLPSYVQSEGGVNFVQISCLTYHNYYLNNSTNQLELVYQRCGLVKPLPLCSQFDNSQTACNSRIQCQFSTQLKRCIYRNNTDVNPNQIKQLNTNSTNVDNNSISQQNTISNKSIDYSNQVPNQQGSQLNLTNISIANNQTQVYNKDSSPNKSTNLDNSSISNYTNQN